MDCFIDVGTTTIVGTDGKRYLSFRNPQAEYGADVVSRMQSAKIYGYERVRNALIDAINKMVGLLDAHECVFIAANTVLSSFVCNVDVAPLAVYPYKAPSLFGAEYDGKTLGIDASSVYVAPCFSAYIGGDITAGAVSLGIDKDDYKGTFLFIDIGTNGEMLVKGDKWVVGASAATGPAFEGGGISCGMTAVNGAVRHVCYNGGDALLDVIGGGEPKGFCGSGLVDVMAYLADTGKIDEFGTICSGKSIVVGGVTITQDDIVAILLAKSAVRSGIECLLKGTEKKEIDSFYIAGAMGDNLNIKSACRIGMFPNGFEDKAVLSGNTSLSGIMLFKDDDIKKRAEALINNTRIMPLAGNGLFERLFAENMAL